MGPRRGNDWRLTMVLFAVTGVVESLAFGHLSAFTPLFLHELRVPAESIPFWTGFLSALAFVIGLPLLPFWGVWADRYGRKLIIIRSSVVAAIIYALTAASTDVWMLALSRLLAGFVFGNTGVMMAMQADNTPRHRLGMAMAIVSAGSPLGMAAGPFLGGQIVERWGIRTLLTIDAAATVLVVLMLVLLLREEKQESAAGRSTWQGVKEAFQTILKTPAIAALFLVVFLSALGVSGSYPYVPILIEGIMARIAAGGHVAEVIGTVFSAGGVAMALATPFWGPLGDRFGHLAILRFCIIAVAASLVGHAVAGSISGLQGWRIAQGASQGGIASLSMVLLALYSAPEKRASILNLGLFPQQLAWFAGPLIGSGLSLLSLRAPFWFGAAALLVALLATLRLKPTALNRSEASPESAT